MEALTSLLFLLLMAGISLVMGVALLYRASRWLYLRLGWRTALEERGWREEPDEGVVREALASAGFPTGRVRLSWLAERDGCFVARYVRRRGRPHGGDGTAHRVLVVPRPAPGPKGSLQGRVGGILEGVALLGAAAFGVKPRDFEGWEWALVFAPGDRWLERGASAPLRRFLREGEMLAFGDRHAVLALPDGEVLELLDRTDALLDALREATPPRSSSPAA